MRLLLVILTVASLSSAWAQTSNPAANPPATPDVIEFLKQTIAWYRQQMVEEQVASDAADFLFVNDNKQVAGQVVGLSFEYAKAQAQLLAVASAPATDQSRMLEPGRYRSLQQSAAKADEQVRQTQSELESLKQKLQSARGLNRRRLQAAVDEVKSELNLAQARSEAIQNFLKFAGSAGESGSLAVQIDELERSLPELQATSSEAKPLHPIFSTSGSSASANIGGPTQASGLIDLITDLFAINRKIRTIDRTIVLTDLLAQTSQKLRSPLGTSLQQAMMRGDEIVNQPDSADPTVLAQQKRELDALTASFKQSSAVVLPLGKQAILLNLYKDNLWRWRGTVKSQYAVETKSLIMRLAVLFFILAVVAGLSEVWRRATFRYVKDVPRRHQFLLLRRVVVWLIVAVVIAFAFATQLGSLATIAGLMTIGVALALQNLILSVAGYFLLIGKYGVRVGDRVQISGVTGDVVEIGLIRLHLMELAGTGGDSQSTGRVVSFANSVVFQPTGSFFKQIPGTNFVWHEVCLVLAPQGDYRPAEKRILEAVERVYAEYQDKIARQHQEMERTLNLSVAVPKPQSRLRLTQTGLEIIVRFPLELVNAAEIDDKVTRELLKALEQPPRLRLVGTSIPNIEPVGEQA